MGPACRREGRGRGHRDWCTSIPIDGWNPVTSDDGVAVYAMAVASSSEDGSFRCVSPGAGFNDSSYEPSLEVARTDESGEGDYDEC